MSKPHMWPNVLRTNVPQAVGVRTFLKDNYQIGEVCKVPETLSLSKRNKLLDEMEADLRIKVSEHHG